MSAADNHQCEQLLEQIELLKQRLVQSERLTALGELVSTTTHEFNNVLTTIINYAKLGMRHKDNATREKSFEKILLAAIGRPRSPAPCWAWPATVRPARSRPI